jgi:hypothetical protein
MATWRHVQSAIAKLPATREAANKRGQRTWHVVERAFAWERPLGKSDLKAVGAAAPAGPILAVRTADLEMKDALLGSGYPGLFTIPHFTGYPAILIALNDVSLATLNFVLVEGWLTDAPPATADAYLAKQRKAKKT